MRHQGIVLATTSRYRRELLARFGLPFESVTPDYEEESLSSQVRVTPEVGSRIAFVHARGKAESLAYRYPCHLILASDQVCECDGLALEKAGSEDRAREQLRHLSGKEHRLHTAVVLLDTDSKTRREDVIVTTLRMRELTDGEIDYYVGKERPLDSAGSYYSEKLGIALFEELVTSDATAIVGLPLITVRRLLAEVGVDVLRPETWPPGPEPEVRTESPSGDGSGEGSA